MAITIGANTSVMRSVRQLEVANSRLSKTFERLSSGLRINSGKDDAAGLSISTMLNARTRIYSQGLRDLSDSASLLNVCEGAVSSLGNLVARLSELSMQASSGTLSSKQRAVLNSEANALVSEYNRIVKSTSYNGNLIIDGSNDGLAVQTGFGSDQVTQFNIGTELGAATGDGTFTSSTTFTSVSVGVATADINNDGIKDVVRSVWNGSESAYLGVGDGTFTLSQTFDVVNGQMTLIDLNHDGNQDVLGVIGNSPYVAFALGNGDGTFGSATNVMHNGNTSWTVGATDFNNDGNYDLYVAERATNTIQVMMGNGDMTFQAAQTVGTSFETVGAADFNNDGNADLFSSTGFYLGNGDGTFSAAVPGVTGQAAGDFNGDGNLDLVTGSGTSAAVRLGNGDGTFQTAILSGSIPEGVRHMYTADFNGDGNLDIASNPRGTPVRILLGNGNGTFTNSDAVGPGGDVGTGLAVADFNGDGTLDFVTGSALYAGDPDASGRRKMVVDPISLSTAASARTALQWAQGQTEKIARELGMLGSYRSRIENAMSVYQVARLGTEEAGARITDADVAQEISEKASSLTLQQSSVAIVAQANLQPEVALNLLKDAQIRQF